MYKYIWSERQPSYLIKYLSCTCMCVCDMCIYVCVHTFVILCRLNLRVFLIHYVHLAVFARMWRPFCHTYRNSSVLSNHAQNFTSPYRWRGSMLNSNCLIPHPRSCPSLQVYTRPQKFSDFFVTWPSGFLMLTLSHWFWITVSRMNFYHQVIWGST